MNILEARRRILGGEVIKRTAEGNPISVRSLARRYPRITMQGWTEQAQYEGKNLFDATKAKQLDSWISTGVYRHFDIQLKPNTTYTLFVSQNNMYKGYKEEYDGNFDFYLGENENTATSNILFGNTAAMYTQLLSSYTFTTTEVPYYINLYVNLWSEENLQIAFDELLVDMMLVEGSSVVPYEPYTGGAPSPSPDYPQEIVSAGNWNEETQKWEYEIEVGGANLWDKEKASDLNNWVASVTQPGYSDFEIGVYPGQNITLSFPEKPPLGLGCYVGIVLEKDGKMMGWIYHSTNESLTHKAITTKSIGSKIWIRSHTLSISKFISLNPQFQAEYGDKRTEFMSYLKRSVTLTSDRPLTKWDRLEKRGGQWGWVYKSDEIESYTDGGVPGEYFSTTGQLSVGAQVWYETTTETFVPLTTTEQEAMEALHTYRPTTVLSNDAGCEMSLTYKTRKSMEVTA